ncbi:hypothetical protein Cni_G00891 [Canna indica]|uniref:Cyanobacterial aminoacyl-tRNA synthetase CAAD domain-containing protein n=1 Tax=Canna indica TaxID=4628 RepID=A0AAQ3Q0A1_9LILI|nr:hypothetical protein Cni_G00891 [Canna indica]
MELCATSCCRPAIRCLDRPTAVNSLLFVYFSCRPLADYPSVSSISPKSKPGFGRSFGRPLRAKASDEETSTAIGDGDAARKRFEGPSFMMGSSSTEENDPEDDFWSKLNLTLDTGAASSIVLYGAGSLVALWVSAAIVSSIDSLPVFPKVMEVVGLGFTVWFITRYLIFKENREELFRKVDDLKGKILGRDD